MAILTYEEIVAKTFSAVSYPDSNAVFWLLNFGYVIAMPAKNKFGIGCLTAEPQGALPPSVSGYFLIPPAPSAMVLRTLLAVSNPDSKAVFWLLNFG